MTYDLRVENRRAPDVVITDVDERDLCDTINTWLWCGDGTVVVVTPSKIRSDMNKDDKANVTR